MTIIIYIISINIILLVLLYTKMESIIMYEKTIDSTRDFMIDEDGTA